MVFSNTSTKKLYIHIFEHIYIYIHIFEHFGDSLGTPVAPLMSPSPVCLSAEGAKNVSGP